MSKRADDDARAFAEAMRGAKPLAAAERDRVPLPPPTSGAPPRQAPGARARAEAYEGPWEAVTDGATFDVTTLGEAIEARGAGVDLKLMRRLKAGDPRAEARLDLHGRSRDEALAALERFIADARADGKRCVLDRSTGEAPTRSKTAPCSSPLVWRWLTISTLSVAAVLAFVSARPGEGGDGATRVLLRKKTR